MLHKLQTTAHNAKCLHANCQIMSHIQPGSELFLQRTVDVHKPSQSEVTRIINSSLIALVQCNAMEGSAAPCQAVQGKAITQYTYVVNSTT